MLCREAHLTAIARSSTIDGVCAHIVCGIRRQTSHVHRERSRTRSTVGMTAAGGRVMGCAPADAARCHGGSATIGYITAACGCGLLYVGHLARGHRRGAHILCRGEVHLVAVAHACAVFGVGPHVVVGVGSQAGHVHRKAACTCAAVGMATANRGVVARTPAHTALGHLRAAFVSHVAAAPRRGLRDIAHLARSHRRQVGIGGQRLLAAVGCACAVGSVSSHIVGGAWGEIGQLNGEASRACAAAAVRACRGRVVARTPADASLRHDGAACVGHLAMCRGAADVARHHRGQCGCRGEVLLLTIGGALAVGDVSPYVVFRARCEVAYAHGVFSRSCAAVRMVAAGGRAGAGAPANASFRHRAATLFAHLAMPHGRGGGDVGHIKSHHHRKAFQGREAHLRSVGRALAVGGVGSHIIGGIGREVGHAHGVTAYACAAAGMCAAYHGVMARAPADTAFRNAARTLVCHLSTAFGAGSCDFGNARGGHHGQALGGGEGEVVTVCSPLGVGGVGTHMVGLVGCEASHGHFKHA